MANKKKKQKKPIQWHFCILGGVRERTGLTHKKRMACGSRLGAHCIEGYSHILSWRLIGHPWQTTSECSYDVFHLGFIRKCLQGVGFPAVLIINTKVKVVVVWKKKFTPPLSLTCLIMYSPVGRTIWEGLGGVALWGKDAIGSGLVGFKRLSGFPACSNLHCTYGSRYKISATMESNPLKP